MLWKAKNKGEIMLNGERPDFRLEERIINELQDKFIKDGKTPSEFIYSLSCSFVNVCYAYGFKKGPMLEFIDRIKNIVLERWEDKDDCISP